MATLRGRNPKNTVQELLKINASGLTGTLATVESGDGTATPLQLSTTAIALNGVQWPTTGASAGTVLTVSSNGTSLEWANGSSSWNDLTDKPAVIAAGATAAEARTAIDLGNVNNTSDANKPISTATQTALNGKISTGAAPYDIATPVFGKPAASEVVLRVRTQRAFTLDTFYGYATTTATASSAVFTVAKNGSSIGNITFAVSTNASTTNVATTSFAVGDILTITAPASQNATLADIDFFLKGTA